jgi:hypothetical protein
MKSQKRRKLIECAGAALIALALTPTVAAAQKLSDIQSNGPLLLKGRVQRPAHHRR